MITSFFQSFSPYSILIHVVSFVALVSGYFALVPRLCHTWWQETWEKDAAEKFGIIQVPFTITFLVIGIEYFLWLANHGAAAGF
jgi:hypothetical protein